MQVDAISPRKLDAAEIRTRIDEFIRMTAECIGDEPISGFPRTRSAAEVFWSEVCKRVEAGQHALLAVERQDRIVGTLQMASSTDDDHRHRAELGKLLVHPTHRRRGIARRLVESAEEMAEREGKKLLIINTSNAISESLFRQLDWKYCGYIPIFTHDKQGRALGTHIFYKIFI